MNKEADCEPHPSKLGSVSAIKLRVRAHECVFNGDWDTFRYFSLFTNTLDVGHPFSPIIKKVEP